MKKAIFVLVVFVLFVLVMVATPTEELGYDFPLDQGSNKLIAATLALVASLWGAVVEIKKSLLIWTVMILIMALLARFGIFCIGMQTILLAVVMCGVTGIWANEDDEIKDFILTPFKEEKDK